MGNINLKSVFIKTIKYIGISFTVILALMFVTPLIFSDKIKEEIKKTANKAMPKKEITANCITREL